MEMKGTDKMNHSNKHTMDDMAMDSTIAENKMDDQTMPGMDIFSEYNYNYLKSPGKTNFADSIPVKEVLLNLTGNMQRYIWSMNGIPLSETDNIKIKEGEVTRITLNNLTMMHHPMHLHGHFFRVINKNGDYSPLKHTVNVPPMQQVAIEFYGNEYGDWFFHCHILYHLMGGIARVFSYNTPRDPRLKGYPVSKLVHETDRIYTWGIANIASQMSAVNLVSSNIRNQFNFSAAYGYNKNFESEFTYERYLYDYFRVFVGINAENTLKNNLDDTDINKILSNQETKKAIMDSVANESNLSKEMLGLMLNGRNSNLIMGEIHETMMKMMKDNPHLMQSMMNGMMQSFVCISR
jgi:hypothetical protein